MGISFGVERRYARWSIVVPCPARTARVWWSRSVRRRLEVADSAGGDEAEEQCEDDCADDGDEDRVEEAARSRVAECDHDEAADDGADDSDDDVDERAEAGAAHDPSG